MLVNKHHYHRFGDLVHERLMNRSWTTILTSHGNTVSNDICESVILDFAVVSHLWFRKVKVKRRLTLIDFRSDPQLTKNASWPRKQSFTMTWARWPVIAGISRYHPNHRYFNSSTHGATIREQEHHIHLFQYVFRKSIHHGGPLKFNHNHRGLFTQVTIVHEHSWYLLVTPVSGEFLTLLNSNSTPQRKKEHKKERTKTNKQKKATKPRELGKPQKGNTSRRADIPRNVPNEIGLPRQLRCPKFDQWRILKQNLIACKPWV